MKTAIITGITGQDGSYLAELLLSKDYNVIGLYRRSSSPNFSRLNGVINNKNFKLECADLTDLSSLIPIVSKYSPDEFYNLGAQSFVKTSFDQPVATANATGIGVLNCLEAIRMAGLTKDCRFYQASSSEMYGKVHAVPQNENTPFHPRSPYGVAKVFGHYMTVNYRESYGMFACNGILFNHESPRRGEEFVTRKITKWIGDFIKRKLDTNKLYLGNLEAKRDWGHAKDYVEAMWLMLQQKEPGDYVVATGETHTIREFCQIAFDLVNLNYENHVIVSPEFYRPAEVDLLLGDYKKAKESLGWSPKTTFKELIAEMVNSDLSGN